MAKEPVRISRNRARISAITIAILLSSSWAQAQTFYWHRNPQSSGDGVLNDSRHWTSNQNGTGFRPRSTADDEFTADALGSAWTFLDRDGVAGETPPSLTSTADAITLTGAGSEVDSLKAELVMVYRTDLPGDFDVSVRMVSRTCPEWSKAGILAVDNGVNFAEGGFAYVADMAGHGAIAGYDANGNGLTEVEAPEVGGISNTKYLRLARSGTSFTAWYKLAVTDAWIQIGATANVPSTGASSHVGIFANASGPSCNTVFDDFQAGAPIAANDLDLRFSGTGSTADVNANLPGAMTIASIDFTGYTGAFGFAAHGLTVTGATAAFPSGMALNAGTGGLYFTGAGVQILTPHPTAAMPAIGHSGAGTLRLGGALSAVSLTNVSGIFDFNGNDVTLSGNLSVTAGGPATLAGLTGRTITVAGSATFAGASGASLLGLDPTPGWTINATGDLNADFAVIARSSATGSAGTATAACTDGGGNSRWNFPSVNVPATIGTQPSDRNVKVGEAASFTVRANGTAPITYAWRRVGDTAVVGTDSTYAIAVTAIGDDGAKFQCAVSNAFGSTASREALLKVRLCDSLFVAPNDSTVDEGQAVSLLAQVECADSWSWSVDSGSAPRLLDPDNKNLQFTAPRTTGGAEIKYRFTAVFGGSTATDQVVVKIREAIPDPLFSITELITWNGQSPISLRPALANDAALKLHPSWPLRYAWMLSEKFADTVQAGDSLLLSQPAVDGKMWAALCLDNGGKQLCDTTQLEIQRVVTGTAARTGTGKAVSWNGACHLRWGASVQVRVWSWDGRLLWERRGREGETASLDRGTAQALRTGRAAFEFLPE